MKKKIITLVMVCMFVSTNTFAHVMNQNNSFEDLALSKATNEIVLLSALGMVSYLDSSFAFKPSEILTAKDLAAWLAIYHGLEGDTSDELAQAALTEQLISTIEGEATYQLVNEAYFQHKLVLENPDETMTREAFAQFVVAHIHDDIGGHTLLEMADFTAGPTGTIEHAERVKKQMPNGKNAYVYMLTIDGEMYEMGMHPRVIADTVDPTVWVGQKVAESWYGPNAISDHSAHDGHAHSSQDVEVTPGISPNTVAATALQLVVLGEWLFISQQVQNAEDTKEASASVATELTEVLGTVEQQQEQIEDQKSSSLWIYGLVVIIVALLAGLVVKGLRSKKA